MTNPNPDYYTAAYKELMMYAVILVVIAMVLLGLSFLIDAWFLPVVAAILAFSSQLCALAALALQKRIRK